MKYIIFFVCSWALFSCQENRESIKELKVYFDLDSLLDTQVALLVEAQASLTKKVVMDGQEEEHEERPDASGWEEEFIIVRDFNLNKSYYVGSYRKESVGSVTTYVLEDDINAPVKFFDLYVQNGVLEQVKSNYFEDKSIYQHRRSLELQFEKDFLIAYSISGFQKMILKDTINYSISGKVHIP